MAEYIEREALMDHIELNAREYGEDYDAWQILGDVDDFPAADVVPVVRCWECKHRGDEMVCPMCHEHCCDDGDGHLDVWNEDETQDNGFCHKGERREEDGD